MTGTDAAHHVSARGLPLLADAIALLAAQRQRLSARSRRSSTATGMSYPEFAARVNRLASALRRLGVERGDRVAVLLPNIPPMLEAHFGVPLAGGVLVAINTRLASDEIAYILEHSGAKALLVDTELAQLVEPTLADLPDLRDLSSPSKTFAAGVHLPGPEYEAFLGRGRPEPLDWPLDDEDEIDLHQLHQRHHRAAKGVMYTHRGAYLNALGELLETQHDQRQRLPLDAADVPLQRLVLPLGGDRDRRHARLPAQARPRRCLATGARSTASPTSAARRPC